MEVNESVADTPEAKEKRLEGKRMSESYHSVILPLARDPWLGDTYLNSSGHIRYCRPSCCQDLSLMKRGEWEHC